MGCVMSTDEVVIVRNGPGFQETVVVNEGFGYGGFQDTTIITQGPGYQETTTIINDGWGARETVVVDTYGGGYGGYGGNQVVIIDN